jgi:hypothetical protein
MAHSSPSYVGWSSLCPTYMTIDQIVETIKKAINTQSNVLIRYADDPAGAEIREISPFVLGINAKNNLVLRGYQHSGYSESGIHTGWKLILVSKIVDIELTKNMFFPSKYPEYNPRDKGMVAIITAVSKY